MKTWKTAKKPKTYAWESLSLISLALHSAICARVYKYVYVCILLYAFYVWMSFADVENEIVYIRLIYVAELRLQWVSAEILFLI